MDTLKIKRKIVSTQLEIDELENWIGKEVEIIISEKAEMPGSPVGSVSGKLSDFRNKNLMDNEKNGWANAVREKHGNR